MSLKRLMNIILLQMLEEIIISFLLIASTHTLTSFTYNNCPNQFTPSAYNLSLAYANQNLAKGIYSNLFNSQIQLQIQKSLNTGDLDALQAQVFTMDFMLPYILVATFFFLIFVTAICCCTFDRRCPPCESWRRNYIKEPYSKLELRSAMIAAITFSVGILVATIVVFSTFSNLSTDLSMINCGLSYSLDTASNGDQANSWGGFSQIQSQIGNTTALLNGAASTINSSLMNNEWIITGMQKLEDMNLALWTNNQDSAVSTPNPATTATALNAGTTIPTVVPKFIQQSLGPNGTANTMITDIDSGFQVTQKLSKQAYSTYKSAINLANSAQNIISNTNSNLQSITTVTKYLSSIQQSVTAFETSFVKVAVNTGLYIMQAIFGAVLLASMISLLGIISTHIFDLFVCKKFVHTGWVMFGFLYFAVVFVLFILLAVGGLSYNFCQYFGSIIETNNGFVSFVKSSKVSTFNKFFNYLDVCFFQDGNILKKFQLSNEMKTVAEVFLNAQTYLNMQTSGNSLYVDTSIAPANIIAWMNQMTNYSLGINNDGFSSDTSENNPYVALAHMNLYTNQNSVGVNTTCSNDLWVYDVANCTYAGSESIYSPSADTTKGLYIPASGSLCISLNTRISQSAPSIWTSSDIGNRYLSIRECTGNKSSEAYDKIISYANSITNYRDARINLYKSLSDQLSSMLTALNQYNTNITAFTANVNTFFSAVSSLNNIVTNQINGLTISANCSVIADSIRFFYNMYCVNFLYRSVKIVICCLSLLVLMLAAVVAGSVFGLRYGRVQKQLKFKGADSESEIFKNEQMQKSQSSGSSNSSEHEP